METSNPTFTTPFNIPVFSDLHFNPFFDPSLFSRLFNSPPEAWQGIFESSTAPAVQWGEDTDYPLLRLTLDAVSLNLGTSPVVFYTGDLLGHNFADQFKSLYSGPGNVDELMEEFANKTVSFLTEQIRAAARNLPVLFTMGNCDSYVGLGPTAEYLSANAAAYRSLLGPMSPGSSIHCGNFDSTFKAGGYYAVDFPEMNLVIISLNTIAFSTDADKTTAQVVKNELLWFKDQSMAARAAGKRIWLLMHVPPGVVLSDTAGKINANGLISANDVSMMWKDANTNPPIDTQSAFLEIISHMASYIDLTLAGHTHMDEYRTMFISNSLLITPGITPYFSNNPAFKILNFNSPNGIWPTNYDALNCDLAAVGDARKFKPSYTFWKTYVKPSPEEAIDRSLRELTPELKTDASRQQSYRENYYSGHNPPPPTNNADPVPITDQNWPVFWSGIENLDREEFVEAANDYPR